jgi:hypothetical protein
MPTPTPTPSGEDPAAARARDGGGGAPLRAGRWLAAGGLLLAAALGASAIRLVPPAPAPASAPAGAFSAERAREPLGAVLGDGTPRPVGSARAGEALRTAMASLGLETRVQEEFACGRYGFCARVRNLLGRVPGRSPGRAVLLVAHYDSVPAGPGAADDASGVAAVLEAARALSAVPPERDVVLLLDDGEEAGLVGAEAFLRHPWAAGVGAVVNLEARGTGGPSVLFETAGGGARIADLFAASARRPIVSSLFPAVYRLLPNDTDLTSLAALGVPGANLAFFFGGVRYHTPRDDAAHLDLRSLQHQGENALGLARALASADPPAYPAGRPRESVFFDLLGLAVVRYPEPWAIPLAATALGLAVLASLRDVRRRRTGWGGILAGLLGLAGAVAAAAGAGWAAGRLLGLDPVARPWVASPEPLLGAFLLAGLAAAALPPALLARRAGPAGLAGGARLGLGLGAVAAAVLLPGGSYLLLAPALAWGALGLATASRGGLEVDGVATSLVAGLVLFPVAWLLYPALGHGAGPLVAALVSLAALPLSPLAAHLPPRGRVALVASGLTLCAAAAAWARALPPAGPDAPERVVLYFHQGPGAGARVLASPDLGRLPAALRAAAPFSAEARVPFGWGRLRPSFETPVAPLPTGPPEWELRDRERSGDRLRVRARLRSARGAPEAQVAIPPGVDVLSFSFDGHPVARPERRVRAWFGGWTVYRNLSLPPQGTEVEATLRLAAPGEPLVIEVADQSPGLPPAVAHLGTARSEAAVAFQEGDVTLFTRNVRLDVD